ncbi:MAG TPA: FecR family protein [Blastocatellia bacterium]|nr:FecR family protein [Blastocatellia bacterium]
MKCFSALSFLVVLVIGGAAPAQEGKTLAPDEQSRYVVSANSGVVNLVDGEVTVATNAWGSRTSDVVPGLELNQGDVLTSGNTGHAEILLNPGCYLRVGPDTRVVYKFGDERATNSLEIARGSLIIEASALDQPLVVATPAGAFTIVQGGLCRFNVADGRAEVFVRKGRVLAGNTMVLTGGTSIKEGKKATLQDGSAIVATFDKKTTDGFDDWSRERANSLLATNRGLSSKVMKRSLGDAFAGYNTWVYDPLCNCHTFLPYTLGFSSPYGGSYSRFNPYWYLAPWGYGGSGWSRNGGSGNSGGTPASGSGTPGVGHPPAGNSGGGHSAPSAPRSFDPPSHGRTLDREMPAPGRSGRRP